MWLNLLIIFLLINYSILMPNNGKRKRNEDEILNINKNKRIEYQNILNKLEEDKINFKINENGIVCKICNFVVFSYKNLIC